MCHGLLEYHGLKVLLHVLKNELETIKRFASWNNFPKCHQQYYEESYK